MKILITGGTGLVGRELCALLAQQGHELILISRNPEKAKSSFGELIKGDLEKSSIEDPRLAEVEAVIHLMGESIAGGRWTDQRKKEIRESRIRGTQFLLESLQKSKNQKKPVLISTSAVGFYGDRGDEELDEQKSPGADFLAQVCVDWEKEAGRAEKVIQASRVVIFRFGVILSPEGGALAKMKTPFQWGVGGALGDGQQWMSWVHLQDVVHLICWALGNSQVSGIFNATAPGVVRNLEFSQALAKVFGHHLLIPVPKFALKTLLGEMSEALLFSQKALSQKAVGLGYVFQFPEIAEALGNCLKGPRAGR